MVTAALEHEHRSAETVVATMSTIADHLEQGRRIDVSLLSDVIFFLRIFADECQEAKEESLLFPALEAKCVSGSACPTTTAQERAPAGWIPHPGAFASGRRLHRGNASAQNSLVRTLRALATLYREHIWKENHVLLPLAEKVLSQEEQDMLSQAFQSVESKISPDEVAGRIGRHAQRCLCYLGEFFI